MQQIVSHSITKSFCFFAAGAALLAVETREIAAVRGLIRRSPVASAALIFGGLGITGAPPLAVFLSEFSILKAGLSQRHFLATGLLAHLHRHRFFRCDAAHQSNGFWRAGRGRRCGEERTFQRRKRTINCPSVAAWRSFWRLCQCWCSAFTFQNRCKIC